MEHEITQRLRMCLDHARLELLAIDLLRTGQAGSIFGKTVQQQRNPGNIICCFSIRCILEFYDSGQGKEMRLVNYVMRCMFLKRMRLQQAMRRMMFDIEAAGIGVAMQMQCRFKGARAIILPRKIIIMTGFVKVIERFFIL